VQRCAAHLECCDSEGAVDIGYATPLDVGLCGCLQQAVEPNVVIEPDAHDEPCILQPKNVLRFRLIVLGIEIGRHQAERVDQIAAHRFGQTAQIGGRGNYLNPIATPRR
jgi:hypothetical protein